MLNKLCFVQFLHPGGEHHLAALGKSPSPGSMGRVPAKWVAVGVRADRDHGAGSNRNTSHRGCTYWRRPSIRQTIVTTMAIITKTAPTPEARSGKLPASGAAARTAATTLMPSAESATAATVSA